MATFMDGCMDAKERDRVIFHLNRCEACSELFNISMETPFSPADEGEHGKKETSGWHRRGYKNYKHFSIPRESR